MLYLGMIAGILNKLGKIGVIVGFALGNAILTYVANGNTVPVITIREILIASLGLLLLPKNIDIDIFKFSFGCAGFSLLRGLFSSCDALASHRGGFSCSRA